MTESINNVNDTEGGWEALGQATEMSLDHRKPKKISRPLKSTMSIFLNGRLEING